MADGPMLELGWKILASQPFSAFLVARATVVHHGNGNRQAVCRCDVFASESGNETPCATAQGTIVRLPAPD